MSYAEQLFLAEEIGRQIKIQSQQSLTLQSSSQATINPLVNVKEIIPTTADILNHHLNEASKWYEIKLDRRMVTWQLRCRSNNGLHYSYSPACQTYFTLKSGEVLSADVSPNSDLNAIWVRCATANVIVELEFWKK